MTEKYYVIHNGDGDTTVEELSKDELLERLKEYYYGEVDVIKKMPEERDTNYWDENILIIKGNIVSPVEKKIITEFDIE